MHPSASSARRTFAVLGAACGLVALAYGCGTDAVGVDACRQIETARCQAAPACTGDDDTFGIRTEEQVQNCVALYNDQCLHGMENAEDGEPDQGDVDRCVAAIEATAACKKNGAANMTACADVAYVGGDATTATPCQVLHSPENLEACTFIKAKAEDGDTTSATTTTGSGGTGGTGGA